MAVVPAPPMAATKSPRLDPATVQTLEDIQRRILWLATLMIHHANHVRPNPDGTKVGGHQASSASTVTIQTALYFHFLQAGDRVAIKPHASPVFHAIQYLLGRLPRAYLTELRAYGGLQSYPSRTKDPDPVDFSTGSVGLGAVAPAFAAMAHRYAETHFGQVTSRRFVALIGDAELDEGSVWEAILDEALNGLGNLLWIVDLNRQSLDRVIPGVRAARLKRMFASNGWRVLEAKYGRRLQALFARPGGHTLRHRIDDMSNEEYQALIRLPGPELRPRLIANNAELAALIADLTDAELPATLANLGGHDLEELIATLAQVEADPPQPTILFAYTIKGWGLPIAGHPLNHSMLLSQEQIDALRDSFGIAPGQEWDAFDPDSRAGRFCAATDMRLHPPTPTPALTLDPARIPHHLEIGAAATISTQETFGRLLVRLADTPGIAERVITVSPDVSVSTNLAGWINKTGVYAPLEEPEYETEAYRLLRWKRGPSGRHIELGISEMNLFMALGMLGLSHELCGQPLIPIGTVYDPFVLRGLDALIYSIYSGAKFIVVGTPSGITLAPEGGAHQSTVTPSLGIELPKLHAWEPCYARELEWTLLEALRDCCDRAHGHPTYLRLSTRPIDQQPFQAALARYGEAELRRRVLNGGYILADWQQAGIRAEPGTTVYIAASGTLVPEALAAAEYLWHEGVAAVVWNIVGLRRLFEQWRAGVDPLANLLIAPAQRAPIVTVMDGAAHAAAWLGSIHGAPVVPLGVDDFGQSGTRADLYHHFGIDPLNIAEAAFRALERP